MDYYTKNRKKCPQTETINSVETIAAIATPPGVGGIGIVRVSGPEVLRVAKGMLNHTLRPKQAYYSAFKTTQGKTLDCGIALYFKAPHSFTGEDVLELQGHGGPIILERVLQEVLTYSVRRSQPGEFSLRAYLNQKIDLAQAEAIADLIHASSEQAAGAAMRTLEGAFSKKVRALNEQITQLRVFVEAALDFSEEEIDFLSQGQIVEKLKQCLETLEAVLKQAESGVLLTQGIKTVIIGKPNAGKSSLLNQLTGTDSAIVTRLPGTTRDIISEKVQLNGMLLELLDTAGLRDSEDLIEQAGIEKAKAALKHAQLVLCVEDISQEQNTSLARALEKLKVAQNPNTKYLLVCNKMDLLKPAEKPQSNNEHVLVSAKTGAGIQTLAKQIQAAFALSPLGENNLSARSRHLVALKEAKAELNLAIGQSMQASPLECLAEHLRLAQAFLGEILGEFTNDQLLGRIFSSFCVGK